ncbi:hypothetical protein V1478_003742 [Vespula squamosa]|uniref:Uncharacterized protein n=1 Tax=Vespula squamosa TaxID=30214 RepID=A0ABD2BMP5_VESSQ
MDIYRKGNYDFLSVERFRNYYLIRNYQSIISIKPVERELRSYPANTKSDQVKYHHRQPLTRVKKTPKTPDQRYYLSHKEKFTKRKIHNIEEEEEEEEEEDIDEVPQGLEMRSTNAENEDRRHRVAESVKAERKDRICGGGQERKDSVCSFVKSREGARRYRGEPIPLSPSRKSKSPIPLRLVPAGNKDGSAYVQAANRRRSQAALCGPGQRK